MKLSDTVIASYENGFSGLYIKCPNDSINEIADKFLEMFGKTWNGKSLEEDKSKDINNDGEICENDIPGTVYKQDSRIFVDLNPLFVDDDGMVENDHGQIALIMALSELRKLFPEISFEGIIQYEWFDERGGDVVKYEISSEKTLEDDNKTYEFIESKLNSIFQDEELSNQFWDKLQDHIELDDGDEYEFKLILRDFYIYKVPDTVIERLLTLAEEYDEDTREDLESMLNSLKNGEDVNLEIDFDIDDFDLDDD